MLKKSISILLSMILVLSAISCAFAAGIGGGGSDMVAPPNSVKITSETTVLTSGTYIVPANTTVQLKDAISVEGNVNLYLEEGGTLLAAENAIWAIGVTEKSTLSIYGNGKVEGSIFANGAKIYMYGGTIESPNEFSYCIDAEFDSEFKMYGGTLENSYFGVNLQQADFEMYAGTIKDCSMGIQAYGSEIKLLGGNITSCGVGVYFSTSELTLGGSIKIEDCERCGIDLWSPESLKISKEVPPTDEMHVGLGLDMYKPEYGSESRIEEIPGEYVKYFYCDDNECFLKNDNGTLVIVNRIEEKPSDYYPVFKLSDEAFAGKTIEYQWYRFDKTEVTNDEKYISEATGLDDRYANVTRSYNKKDNAWVVKNPLDVNSFYEDNLTAADYILHVPAKTYITVHGVLNGIPNQYAVAIMKGTYETSTSSYDNMGVDLGVYVEDKGDLSLYSYYYTEEGEEIDKEAKIYVIYSHLNYWTLDETAISNSSSLNEADLTPGYYVCKALVKENGNLVESFESDIIWAGGEMTFYDEEDANGYGLEGSVFAMPQTAIVLGAVVIAIAVIVVILKKKKDREENNTIC